ncbi:tellurite resistance TerB family protein [Reyranella sp.]|uniref:tellurite resistance TerB family protein n=1 Tax=Reyranella sp. TaxID=1929291 RepID=UPI003BA8CA5E
MFDAKRLLDQFMGGQGGGTANQGGQGGPADFLKGAGGGALAGGLVAILMGSKTGRKIGGEALKMGGMAAVGALAYKAYRDWQSGKAPVQTSAQMPQQQNFPMLPPPSGTPFNPSTESGQQSLARNLLRAMIAAAKADGHVDADEQARIFAEMDKLPLSSEDKAFVMDELRAKLDVDAVAAAAATPEEAAEIYTASLLSIDVDNAAERGYLAMLAARLNLDDALVAHLQQTVASAAGKAAQPVG